jgi:diguanylate cyclase (GGDEF)-like protein
MIDKLTKIPSLGALEEAIESFSHPKLMLIDLKNFKELNLKYSDEVGDFVLKEFAKNLQNYANENDMLAFRVIEDEFALLKDMEFDLNKIEKLLFGVVEFIKKQIYIFDNYTLHVEAHIGLCLDQARLLSKAKRALIVAQKEDQPFVTYSDFVNRLLEENKEEVCKLLQDSLNNGSIMPYYQKVIDKNDNIIYHEVLLRNKTKDSIQTPKLFLKIAHERGFYNNIVKMVSTKLKNISHNIAINLSANDLFDDNLFDFLVNFYGEKNAIFEIQNDEFLSKDGLEEKFKILKKHNIQICLDNIVDKKEIKKDVDYVKISGNIVRLLHVDSTIEDTCSKIIATCRELNIKSIASHINSKESFEKTKQLNFDYFQGYFIEKPKSTI